MAAKKDSKLRIPMKYEDAVEGILSVSSFQKQSKRRATRLRAKSAHGGARSLASRRSKQLLELSISDK